MPQPLSFRNKVQSVSHSVSVCLSLSLSASLPARLSLSLSLSPFIPPSLPHPLSLSPSLSRTECPNRDSCLGLYLCVKYFRQSKMSVLPFLSRPLVVPETTTNTLFFYRTPLCQEAANIVSSGTCSNLGGHDVRML